MIGTVTGRSYCASHTDASGTAVMQWTSVNASKVFILTGPKADTSTDAKADGGLEYPYNGSVTLPFDCSGDADNFRFDAYNIEGHGGFMFTLRYNA